MKAKITNIFDKQRIALQGLDTSLSFVRFTKHLREKTAQSNGARKKIFQTVLTKLEEAETANGPVTEANVEKFAEELFYVYNLLVPPMADEDKTLWALAVPVSGTLFYGTDAFYKLLNEDHLDENKISNNLSIDDDTECAKENQLMYSFILERLYGFPNLESENLLFGYMDKTTGLPKYYGVKLDFSFVDVKPVGALPALDFQRLKQEETKQSQGALLQQMLPLDAFKFEGFTIITVNNVCGEYAFENIKNLVIDRAGQEEDDYYQELEISLKILTENPNIQFRLLPLLNINGRSVFDEEFAHGSILFGNWQQHAANAAAAQQYMASYTAKPDLVVYNIGMEVENTSSLFTDALKAMNITSYACSPLYYNNQVTGLLEVYTENGNTINKTAISRLKRVVSLLAQLLYDRANEFNNKIDAVIKEKFTSLQPSVQWKFTEVAWEYLRSISADQPNPPVGAIQFNHVYPLYGAIDIRNSTAERNKALNADLTVQLQLLSTALGEINELLQIALIGEMLFNCRQWLNRLAVEPMDQLQQKIRDFLDREIPETLAYFKSIDKNAAAIIQRYEADIHAETGIAYAKRRELETSMTILNTAINSYLELLNMKIQQSYPCYFEKFRTDGVEYDIYIGQSITPSKPFNKLLLKNVQLWQITSMASIAKITQSLLPQMPTPLETTQLIFVNTGDIDISFRVDERRFDVEGTYNIRYQVIKKRIDKVHIKDSTERLTQPGKIALVYFNEPDIQEYKNYIAYLQNQEILLNDLEELELEELQGVSGLKALRIGVNL